MQILATDGFGTVKTIERSTVFFKKLPADLSDDVLAMYEVPRERYLLAFNERADKSIINKDLFNRFLTYITAWRPLKERARYHTRGRLDN